MSEETIMNERTNQYKLCIDTFTGVGGYWDGSYLQKFAREEDFEGRKANSFYKNNVVGMVASATAPVFGDKVQRKDMSDMYAAFAENVDMRGTTLTNWLQTVAEYHTLLSNVFIVMDNVQEPDENVQVAIANRSFPFLTYKTPDLVEDVKIDNTGKITSITFYLDKKTVKKEDGSNGANTNVYRTIEDGVIRDFYKDKENKKYIGDPITATGTKVIMTGSEPLPIPRFLSLSEIARAIYNMDSEQRDLERAQAFNILQVPGKPVETSVEVGPRNVLYVDPDSGRDAKYISPDANVLQVLGLSSDRINTDMKDQARNLGIRVIEKHYKSGDALELDYAPSYSILSNLSMLFEDLEYKIRDMFVSATGVPDKTVVTYNRDYSPSPDKIEQDYNTLVEAQKTKYGDERDAQIKDAAYKKLALITGMEELDAPVEPVVDDVVAEEV